MAAHHTDQSQSGPALPSDDLEPAALIRELDGLRAAMATRETIAQAQGMLMARHHLTADAAFALLVRLSQQSNVKLRDIATQIVADCSTSAQD